MKTFFDLKQEILAAGRCHGCGGCVTFCTAVNYGALELGEENIPRYKSVDKCIDCGLCYQICPAVAQGEEAIKQRADWQAPAGQILSVHSARVRDPYIRGRVTDGGAVTGVLLHLFDKGHIDGAIVTMQDNGSRKPLLTTTRDEIIRSAGTSFDNAAIMAHLGASYSTYSPSIQAMGDLMRNGLRRIAFVGTPCQIKAVRKMQALNIVPADAIRFCFGLFCSANYALDWQQLAAFDELSDKSMADLKKINIKENFILHFKDGSHKDISLAKMEAFRRPACGLCDEFAAEYADIAFGGVGSDEGWTTVITRTPLGRAVFIDALEVGLEEMSMDDHHGCIERARDAMLDQAVKKRKGCAQR